ncbi:GlsB/YeaQ/YmgE family stress response membrane protein [Streptococcus iniae]
MGVIWTLIVGGLIGLIAGALTKKGGSMGWIANIFAGLVGAYVGQALLGTWESSLADMALIPSVIGAVIVVVVTSFLLKKLN